MTIAAVVAVVVATAWPDLALAHYRPKRRRTTKARGARPGSQPPQRLEEEPSGTIAPKKAVGWQDVGKNVLKGIGVLLALAALFVALVGVILGIKALSTLAWHAAGLPTIHGPHNTKADKTAYVVIGLVVAAAIGLALVAAGVKASVRLYRENQASQRGRSSQYSGDDLAEILGRLRSQYAVKAFVQAFRVQPRLCSREALAVLSDLAAGADLVLHGRAQGGRAPVPRGSSLPYSKWAMRKDKDVQKIISWFDQEAIDSVALLSDQVHGLGSP